jgi:isopropylmalate/homocitrate/citramalate synthase
MNKKIGIYDTTLRDGEQMPGVIFSPKEKIELGLKINEFGVDAIELMPAVSEGEAIATKCLCGKAPIVCSTLSRKSHIDLAKECGAKKIVLFSSLSDIHLVHKLGISREKNLKRSLEFIEYATKKGLGVDFAGEDSSRADFSYLLEFIKAIQDKISCFLPCDTLGCLSPFETYSFIRGIKENCQCKIGLHIHNDFGLATANTLAGLEAGAEMFSGTFTGIGERAGNAPIEEVVVALNHIYDIELDVNYSMIDEICSLVERYGGVKVQEHKPICGGNAFTHESGIHVDGIIKYPLNYELYDPVFVGGRRKILFGKHSGKGALKHLFGRRLSEEALLLITSELKKRSELGKRAYSREEVMGLANKVICDGAAP